MVRLVRLVGINTCVLAALLLAIEGAVRLTHPHIGPLGSDRALVADSVYDGTQGIAASARGISGGELFTSGSNHTWIYSGSPEDAPPWLFLGDSVTMGSGVDPDSTFAGRLAQGVQMHSTALIGLGVRDYGPTADHQMDWRRHSGVALIWCLNDLYPPSTSAGAPAQMRGLSGPVHAFVLKHIRTYQVLKALLFDRPAAYYRHDMRLYSNSDLVRDAADRVVRIASRAQQADAQFVLVVMPYREALRDPEWPRAVGPWFEALRDRGIDVIDASQWLAGDPNDLFLYGDGIHLSTQGHRQVAEGLASVLQTEAARLRAVRDGR